MMQPLHRVEKAIAGLSEELQPVGTLPAIHEQLVQVNTSLVEVVQLLTDLRADLSPRAAA
jgi:hypothetical protein